MTATKLVYHNFPHSSAIESISYEVDPVTKESSLQVKFRKGGVTYEYPQFPKSKVDAFLEDAKVSPGRAFHSHIKATIDSGVGRARKIG